MGMNTVERLIQAWQIDPQVAENVVEWRVTPARPARLAPFPGILNPSLAGALSSQGIASLYTHQAEAFRHATLGENLVIVTGTASGKTLCYNLPVLDFLFANPEARALYIFPTKALAHDQTGGLEVLIRAARERGDQPGGFPPLSVASYDGDTPTAQRSAIRSNARIIVSNPDMLHTGVLPHHTLWADFFRNLRYVVIDEIHTYRGVFGSHVANVLRRLKRIAAFYGSVPQFIMTSATIANPLDLGERLCESNVMLIDDDGAAHGAKHFLLFNPPVVNADLGIRKSALLASTQLANRLLAAGLQTIIFGRSRRSVEIVLNYLRGSSPSDELERLRGYRSGYLPSERRAIEHGLRSGEVKAVVATNALELGIDIGGMEAALLVGYPGSIAATQQQAGRAGRKTTAALAILVTTADPLDQFLARHPEYIFERIPEQALINPDNMLILLQHLRCAAFELPFRIGDGFGRLPADLVQQYLEFLEESGELHQAADKFFWMADQYPADHVSLRSASPQSVLLQAANGEAWQTIGEVDLESASWLAHPNAVYLHDGQSYLVEELDLKECIAHLRQIETDYYTEPRRETTVESLGVTAEAPAQGCTKAYGDLLVTTKTTGFRKIKWYTHEQLGGGDLDLPPSQLHTTGYWLSIDEATVDSLREQGMWTNDANDYGPEWPSIRERVRARDGYRCRICGAPESGRQHHVHHKTPFRTFASVQQANSLDNLVTLCPNCHRLAETNLRMRSGLAGLGYALGNLAPLFLMCDSRDVGIHSDPQAPFAGGKPAVVIYDEIPAGIGFSERLYIQHDELIRRAHQLVSECGCADGCPSCVGPAGENGQAGKAETLALLHALTGSPENG